LSWRPKPEWNLYFFVLDFLAVAEHRHLPKVKEKDPHFQGFGAFSNAQGDSVRSKAPEIVNEPLIIQEFELPGVNSIITTFNFRRVSDY